MLGSCPYSVYWKVRNVGPEAERRDMTRGKILDDRGNSERIENTNFYGPHYVECYIIEDGVCAARDRIGVPISTGPQTSHRLRCSVIRLTSRWRI